MENPKRIAITGASGLIGAALKRLLLEMGHEVHALVRHRERLEPGDIYWSVKDGEIDVEALEGVDAVVHLAGENISGVRWTAAKKERILESRRQGTRLLSDALAGLSNPPAVLVSASGINVYGDRGAEWIGEDCEAGAGFLAQVCVAWEEATASASEAGIRVVNLRTGMVLSAQGGALPAMLPAFKLGAGGKMGSGQQYMSWITLTDHVRAIVHAIEDETLSGPVNAVSPNPVTNEEFTKALGAALNRPTFMAVPGLALRLALGQMGEELLLQGVRASSAKLVASGFVFEHPELAEALELELKGGENG